MTNMKRVVVIGGGASGLAAAIAAAESGAQVTLLEASEHVGKPILATGNGRCNLTNAHVRADAYNHPEFVAPALERYGAKEILAFFERWGLATAEEAEGRVYPLSRTASSVVDVLRVACERLGIEARCGDCVRRVRQVTAPAEHRFRVLVEEGDPLDADAVVIATGGGTDPFSALGHELVAFRPVLCSLATDVKPLRGLDGVRAHARVAAYRDGELLASERGEVLFRKYGLSGIVIFDLSRLAEAGDVLALDLLPDLSLDKAQDRASRLFEEQAALALAHETPEPTYAELLAGVFHPRVAVALTRSLGLKASLPADADGIARVMRRAKDFRIEVIGIGDAKHAQVTRGGAAVDGFDAETLESLVVPGIYACGEVLDVDGPCGGYNLHWAWASGLVAGTSAASRE